MFNYKKGITIIEILISIAIIVVLLVVVLPRFSDMRENQAVQSAVADVVSTINKARSQSLASISSLSYGVHFNSDSVIIFTGTTFSDGIASNEEIPIIPPAEISNINLTGGAQEFYFNRISGEPNIYGTVTVSSPNFSKIITISSTGVVSVN